MAFASKRTAAASKRTKVRRPAVPSMLTIFKVPPKAAETVRNKVANLMGLPGGCTVPSGNLIAEMQLEQRVTLMAIAVQHRGHSLVVGVRVGAVSSLRFIRLTRAC